MKRGDIVFMEVGGSMKGIAVVLDRHPSTACPDVLRVHDCRPLRRAHYINIGWCRKVGEATPEMVERALASHAEVEQLDAERAERARRHEDDQARIAFHAGAGRQLHAMFGV